MDTFHVIDDGEDVGESLTYSAAVALVDEICDELTQEGWSVEHGWASSGNYYAAKAEKNGKQRFVAVEKEES